jgi:RNA polymerase sigma-70 factor (ECF subfamily)
LLLIAAGLVADLVLVQSGKGLAATLEMTTAAVNSALQRARAMLGEAGLREDQELLTDDAVLEMPG